DEFCILYAPTWRDTQKIRPGRYAMKLMPDLDRLQKSLPGSQLIFRAHHLMAAQIGAHDNAKVQDVSAFPDVAQQYLAADVLISDYSSVIVDYAITGKPILLYTPDLEEYGGHVRGFYGDFAGEVPAPFLKDEAALLDALSQVKSGLLEETCRERYARWQAKFCALEDGNAARRVVERVLPSLLGDGGSQGQV
ncbi:MAG: CDP-glycerol:poly(glycerophosphate) glycerophosphotransferase, partial [Massilia sp.]|nr:CDP-glycerol:poly(glycerophosphate) glycerophosphotransferase [Massilia sp.]